MQKEDKVELWSIGLRFSHYFERCRTTVGVTLGVKSSAATVVTAKETC
ncbi:hypothetical protein GJ688_16405 [Heliobacillus mobilis]|uniref:Uncharacterized protein n=1 Tax=Heliobacterium mobile TaxID=28064 RepID=A0A6I3SNG3_HELMO|nr:hypothetical protein [Heliobacterium mobile]MTV50528.1 hypothetical protein [Heliobacterium mobile]